MDPSFHLLLLQIVDPSHQVGSHNSLEAEHHVLAALHSLGHLSLVVRREIKFPSCERDGWSLQAGSLQAGSLARDEDSRKEVALGIVVVVVNKEETKLMTFLRQGSLFLKKKTR